MPVLVKLTHYHFARWQPKCIVGTGEFSDARQTPYLSTSLLEQERLYKRLCQFETIGPVSESMRRLIEDVWPELVSKLPPKQP